ncbi:hypothetical protein LEP1GSC193_0038 [Leptospira alstonii serovar Pingchang str. 80-412]|uniref:Uncharacterized protein n=2 Tax=Leptospira alstonii TaxID=28452 RepID=M6CTJ4_9LEPT|nr:hypothetical protein LEP1GSC194_0991 [Leptospira alstonii serovar Sichuan str. 79601]EQA79099.1 hypothetical protein LEP1GSC193_0038 [Leptospira alstonii serovar Pingchang str. 80-412]
MKKKSFFVFFLNLIFNFIGKYYNILIFLNFVIRISLISVRFYF